MPEPRIPVDARIRAIAALYEDARVRLERLVRDALERQATGTAAYRAAQLERVLALLSALQDDAVPLAASTASQAYTAGALAAEAGLKGRALVGFGGVHQAAVDVLADNIVNRLNAAAVTVGRRTEDAFRAAGLRESAAGIATGGGRREVSDALAKRLVEQGTTDALTGFVDKAGKRWPLDVYARMVARTTVREAVTQGTVNRLLERGPTADLVTVSSHANPCPICVDYDGATFSLSGRSSAHPALDQMPPFHPNCSHVLTPAAANLDAFEQALREAA